MARPFLAARLVLVGALAGAASVVALPGRWPIAPVATAAAFQTRGPSAGDSVRTGEATANVQCVPCHKLPPRGCAAACELAG